MNPVQFLASILESNPGSLIQFTYLILPLEKKINTFDLIQENKITPLSVFNEEGFSEIEDYLFEELSVDVENCDEIEGSAKIEKKLQDFVVTSSTNFNFNKDHHTSSYSIIDFGFEKKYLKYLNLTGLLETETIKVIFCGKTNTLDEIFNYEGEFEISDYPEFLDYTKTWLTSDDIKRFIKSRLPAGNRYDYMLSIKYEEDLKDWMFYLTYSLPETEHTETFTFKIGINEHNTLSIK